MLDYMISRIAPAFKQDTPQKTIAAIEEYQQGSGDIAYEINLHQLYKKEEDCVKSILYDYSFEQGYIDLEQYIYIHFINPDHSVFEPLTVDQRTNVLDAIEVKHVKFELALEAAEHALSMLQCVLWDGIDESEQLDTLRYCGAL